MLPTRCMATLSEGRGAQLIIDRQQGEMVLLVHTCRALCLCLWPPTSAAAAAKLPLHDACQDESSWV